MILARKIKELLDDNSIDYVDFEECKAVWHIDTVCSIIFKNYMIEVYLHLYSKIHDIEMQDRLSMSCKLSSVEIAIVATWDKVICNLKFIDDFVRANSE